LVMLFTMTTVSFAGGKEPGGDKPADDDLICVDGYVINHREDPVDGTEFDPQLAVYAFGYDADALDAEAVAGVLESVQSVEDLEAMVDEEGAAGSTGMIRERALVDSDGYYKFEDLPKDYYYAFAIPLPEDWEGIVPKAERSGVAIIWWTQLEEPMHRKCHRVVWKIRRLFDITVIKWEELQDNSVQPGEGWDIVFDPQDDPFVKKQTEETDENGTATFTVTPGEWYVYERVKEDWTPVTPAKVTLELDQYAPPGATDPVVFKNREPVCFATIEVEKNGLGTDSETGQTVWLGPLAGWKVRLTRQDGQGHPLMKTTDGSGRVKFEDLNPGVYEVEEFVPPGWEALSDNPQTVVVRNCETVRVLFENLEVPGELKISGKKYYKAWVSPYKGDEVGLAGWVISATLKGTEDTITTMTDALGEYEFDFDDENVKAEFGFGPDESMAGQTIEICEEERDNWVSVGDECVDVTFPYPVPVDYEGATVDFTNYQHPTSNHDKYPGKPGDSGMGSCSEGHKVSPGENLTSIAAAYETSVKAIVEANNLSDPNMIRTGQVLCIP
jgi:hypothetical protein